MHYPNMIRVVVIDPLQHRLLVVLTITAEYHHLDDGDVIHHVKWLCFPADLWMHFLWKMKIIIDFVVWKWLPVLRRFCDSMYNGILVSIKYDIKLIINNKTYIQHENRLILVHPVLHYLPMKRMNNLHRLDVCAIVDPATLTY